MTEFMTRAAVYWIVFMAVWCIKLIMHDETWRNPKEKPMPKILEPLLYALVSLIPFVRFVFATLAVWFLFVPPKGSKRYEEMKSLWESEHGQPKGNEKGRVESLNVGEEETDE